MLVLSGFESDGASLLATVAGGEKVSEGHGREGWGDMGSSMGEVWGDVGRCGERYGEMWGEVWGGMGRCGEMWGDDAPA